MRKLTDLSGKIYGRLTVISYGHKIKSHTYWNCICSCGNHKLIRGSHLSFGKILSCGCLRYDHQLLRTHGETSRHGRTKEYRTWISMRARCMYKDHPSNIRYTEAGITVCDRWQNSYENFLLDMGRSPSESHTIDRINNKLGYSPDNCRWATKSEQAYNRRPRSEWKKSSRLL